MVEVIQRDWANHLADLVASAQSRLLIATPFISDVGASFVSSHINSRFRDDGRVEVITDLSPQHVCDGSLEPRAVSALCQTTNRAMLWHIPRFHAKVYLADTLRAIVTSGNLSAGALYRNVEYGVRIDDPRTVSSLSDHFQDFQATGTCVALDQLLQYAQAADRVRDTFIRQQRTVDGSLRRAFESALGAAEDELIRMRLAGVAVHTIFARTIHYLLNKYGPLPTTRLHELIQQLHPELCDDSIDRVIDGKRFGKKWKHAVRTAQQQLKRSGEVIYADGVWQAS